MIVYRLLPSRGPRGWPLWAGALATALMLVAGRSLVAAYVSAGAIDTAYGAAGSAVVFLIWAYWSSLGFLFGARLAWALDDLWRRPLAPAAAPSTGLAPASEAPQPRDS
jgi:membrane protein